MLEVDLAGNQVVHGDDDLRPNGFQQRRDQREVDRGRSAGGGQNDVSALEGGQLILGERVAKVAQVDDVQVLGAKVQDGDLITGQLFGGLVTGDGVEADAVPGEALGRNIGSTNDVERWDDLAEVASGTCRSHG